MIPVKDLSSNHIPLHYGISNGYFRLLPAWGNIALRVTSHTRLKAHDHCIPRAIIGRKGGDRPSSLHTWRWKPKGPKKTSWMKSPDGVLHGGLWIRFRGPPEFSSSLPPRGGPDAHFGRPWSFECFIFQRDKYHDKFQGKFHYKIENRFHDKFHDRQTPPNRSLEWVEFETYYIQPNPPLFFHQQSMQWSRNMVHSHFTLCLRVCDVHFWSLEISTNHTTQICVSN